VTDTEILDCVVVGGGAAGLSAALTLGRARRRTLLVDAGRPSNLVAPAIGGLLGHDGRAPAAYYAAGRAELSRYPSVELREDTIHSAVREEDGTFLLNDGVRARSVLLATGMDYRIPVLNGLAERFGASAFHCPFCHGWENRDRGLGVLARGAVGVHGALNLRGLSDEVTLLTGGEELTTAQRDQLRAGGVAWDERTISGLEGPGRELRAVVFDDGGRRPIEGLLVKAVLHQRSGLAASLGAAVREPDEMLSVQAVEVDPMFRTTIPGLYAAGDTAASVPPSLAAAVSSGYLAAASAAVRLAAGY
jgi:thioredoxin reductase